MLAAQGEIQILNTAPNQIRLDDSESEAADPFHIHGWERHSALAGRTANQEDKQFGAFSTSEKDAERSESTNEEEECGGEEAGRSGSAPYLSLPDGTRNQSFVFISHLHHRGNVCSKEVGHLLAAQEGMSEVARATLEKDESS